MFNPPLLRKDKDKRTTKELSLDSDTIIGARIRPLIISEKDDGHVPGAYVRGKDDYADVHELRQKANGRLAITTSSFQFDRTYGPSITSAVIYEDIVAPLVPWAWAGGISTLFAYGQTGSGKTFTIDQLETKVAQNLFNGGLEGSRDVFVCVFELEGNVASDLLNDRHKIKVMEDSFGETQLVGIVESRAASTQELLGLVECSMSFRKSAPTSKNDISSRTHAIGGNGASRTKQAHIPYRNSILTRVLKHVFDTKGRRHCKTTVIACASPSFIDPGPSKNTFRYVELLRVSMPPFKLPVHQENVPPSWTPTALRAWIEDNSGDPPISASFLAPTENGMQICRIPQAEFISRCTKTPGVNEQQAREFYDKLWRMHIASREARTSKEREGVSNSRAAERKQRAADQPQNPLGKSLSTKIRPGMFIQKKGSDTSGDSMSKVMVMCPEWAFSGSDGAICTSGGGHRDTLSQSQRYTCAVFTPSPITDTYELDVRTQTVVGVEEMERELLMEYDSASRYYHLTA